MNAWIFAMMLMAGPSEDVLMTPDSPKMSGELASDPSVFRIALATPDHPGSRPATIRDAAALAAMESASTAVQAHVAARATVGSMRSVQGRAPRRHRSATRIVIGAAVGATAGFFGGGFLGAAIEGDRCDCDDPGLVGFLIGAPVGAVTGGILGGKFLF